MSTDIIPQYNPSYRVTPESLFHDVVFQLAYNQGYNNTETVLSLHNQLKQVLHDVGGKRDSLHFDVHPDTYGVTLAEVGAKFTAVQAENVSATIVNAAQEFAEFVTMDLTPYVELEEGEEYLTKDDITAKVVFAMVNGAEYTLGKWGRDKAPNP